MTKGSSTRRGDRKPQSLADAVQERLDATPERLARAGRPARPRSATAKGCAASSIRSTRCALTACSRRIFELNDIRWLIGESLRRTHQRARLDACAPSRPTGSAHPALARARPAAIGGGAPRPRQNAQGRRAGRTPRLADCHADHHRGRGRARMPRLHPRTRHALAGGCRRRPTGCKVALNSLGPLLGVTRSTE